jgi:alkylation response protein AidB-like acyl-CoA dehydrogenase
MAVTNMVGEVIAKFGTEAQRERTCPRLTSGEYVAGSFALSEPEAGSDPGAMRTTARARGGRGVLDGQKQWITSGAHAGVFVVWARTGGPGTKGISCFLVEGGTPEGPEASASTKTRWACAPRTPCRSRSTNCGCPPRAARRARRRLQDRDDGARRRAHRHRLAGDRHRDGRARGRRDYAKQRKQFGKTIGDFQAIQWMLADSRTELDAARC